MGEMKETVKTGSVMKNFSSIANKLAHTVACVAIVPFLPVIALMWIVALTCDSTGVTETNERSLSTSDVWSDSQDLLLSTTA